MLEEQRKKGNAAPGSIVQSIETSPAKGGPSAHRERRGGDNPSSRRNDTPGRLTRGGVPDNGSSFQSNKCSTHGCHARQNSMTEIVRSQHVQSIR